MLISSAILSLKVCLPVFWFMSLIYILRPPVAGFKRSVTLISILILVLFGFNINTIMNVLPVDTLEWFYSFTVFVSVVISIGFFRYLTYLSNSKLSSNNTQLMYILTG